MTKRRRAMTSDQARRVRQQGLDDALRFAHLIGLEHDYENDPQAKKDVIDRNGDAHSVKSGKKKWQIFLYSRGRFEKDLQFRFMDGIGDIILNCIDAFPPKHGDYTANKQPHKERLRPHMRALKEKLSDEGRLSAFFDKAMFNAGEVAYLTILHEELYHVFFREDVIEAFSASVQVVNSIARHIGQTSEQKVVFKYGTTIGEIEMRNDSQVHHREVKMWLYKVKTLELLKEAINPVEAWFDDNVLVYGKAIRRFARNHR